MTAEYADGVIASSADCVIQTLRRKDSPKGLRTYCMYIWVADYMNNLWN